MKLCKRIVTCFLVAIGLSLIVVGIGIYVSMEWEVDQLSNLQDEIRDNAITGFFYEVDWLQDLVGDIEANNNLLRCRLSISDLQEEIEVKRAKPLIDVDLVMQSVVHIGASGENGTWQGSGSYVGNGLILTAGHIVYGANTFVITFENSKSSLVSTRSYYGPTVDVGFILLEDCNVPTLIFDNDSITRGDSVWIFGNLFGWDYKFSVSKGIISSVQRDCNGHFGEKIMLQSDAAGFPGVSGGPVTDNEGEIIGICVGGVPGGISLIIPADICEQSMRIYLEILKLEGME